MHGQSLIVRAMASARDAAREADLYLEGSTRLPLVGGIHKRSWAAPPIEERDSGSESGDSIGVDSVSSGVLA